MRSRTRRSSADVRALLLSAARDLFLAQGYDATTTKQISEAAGVAEPLLFTNFGSKTELFDLAVIKPVADFVATYAASWGDRDAHEAERVDAFVRGLYNTARQNRSVLLDALAQRGDRLLPAGPHVLQDLARTLQGLRGISDLDVHHDVDAPAATAAVLGMVLGVAILDDLLFPPGTRRPSRDRLISEMEKLTLYGITSRTADTPQQ